MRYHVITAPDPYKLKQWVNDYLAEGWRPQGSVSHTYKKNQNDVWSQAIVK